MPVKRIWEISDLLYCPVAGYCLSVAEQQAVIKKYAKKNDEKKYLKEIEAHHYIMSNINIDSNLARYVEKLLFQKYRKKINEYKDMDTEDWINEIDNLINCHDFGAMIWISAICKDLNKEQNQYLYYKIHNYSHDMYSELQQTSKNMLKTQDRLLVLKDKYKKIRMVQKKTDNDNSKKDSDLHRLEQKNKYLEEEIEKLKLKIKNPNLNEQDIVFMRKSVENYLQTITDLKAKNKRLQNKIDDNKTYLFGLKNEFKQFFDFFEKQNGQCLECEKIDLCQRRVLIVGGMTKMKNFYRDLISKMGGEFSYHDGGCNGNKSILTNLINQSDIVICPVDINSHAACLTVKKTCKKTGKNYYILRKSSVSTIYNTLVTAANS